MRRINYKSDIPPLLLSLKVDENQITVPDCDFIVRFYIEGYEGRHYDCSHIGGVWSNCEPSDDGTKLVCYINNQRLGIGELCAEFHYISPDRRYSDGSQKSVVIIDSTELGVELVEDNGDAVTEAAIDVTLPFIYRTAYEIAMDHGYTGTAEDFYGALASVVGIAEAEAGRVSSEELREANEQQRVREFDAMKEIVNELDGKVNGVVEDEKSFEDAIRDQVNNYKPIVIEGNVTNAADEEDITSENGLLKLKNRSALNGMGYVILRKDKTFAEQVTQANTIYEIRYDFDLNGAEIEIKEGCTLKFDGGSLRKGTLKNDVAINNISIKQILYDVNLTISNNTVFAEWFGDMSNDILCDSAIAINKAIQATRHGSTIELPTHNIYISSTILVDKAVVINGNAGSIWAHSIIVASDGLTAIIVTKKEFNSGGVIKNLNIRRANENISFIGVDIQVAEHYIIDSVSVHEAKIGFYLSGSAGSLYLVNLNRVVAQYCSEYGILLNKEGSWKNGIHIHPLDVSFNNTNIRVCKGSGNTIQGGATEIGGYLSDANRPSWLTENNGIVIEGGIWTIKDYLWIENCNIGIWVKAGYVNIIDDLYVNKTIFEDDSVVRYENQSLTKKLHKSKINDLVDYAEIIVDGDNTFPTLNNGKIIENFKNYGSARIETPSINQEKRIGGIDTHYYFTTLKDGYTEGFFSKDNIRQFTFLIDFKIEAEVTNDLPLFTLYLSDTFQLRFNSSIAINGLSARFIKLYHLNDGYLGNIKLGNTEHTKGFVRYVFSIDFDTKTIWQYDDESGLLLEKFKFLKNVNISNVTKKFLIAPKQDVGISKLYVFSKLLNQSEINTILNTKEILVNKEKYLTDTNSDIISKFNGNQFYDIKNDCLKLKTSTGIKTIQIANNVTNLKNLDNNNIGTMLFYKNLPTWWNGVKWVNNDGYNSEYLTKGTTVQRPALTSTDEGFEYYDSTLKKKIIWNGTEWTNIDGTNLI